MKWLRKTFHKFLTIKPTTAHTKYTEYYSPLSPTLPSIQLPSSDSNTNISNQTE